MQTSVLRKINNDFLKNFTQLQQFKVKFKICKLTRVKTYRHSTLVHSWGFIRHFGSFPTSFSKYFTLLRNDISQESFSFCKPSDLKRPKYFF